MKKILWNCVYFWIDFIQIYVKQKEIQFFNDLIFEIDEDNSQSAYIVLNGEIFHYSKIQPKGYKMGLKFSLNVDGKIIDCFALLFERCNNTYDLETVEEEYNDHYYSEKYWKITLTLYSQMFSIYYLRKFDMLTFLRTYFKVNEFNRFKRIDLCADFSLSKKDIIKYFRLQEKPTRTWTKKVRFHSKVWLLPWWEYETYYTRPVQSDRNRFMITRIYDKKKDTFKKQKSFLYTHLNTEHVNRVEVEIRKEYAMTIDHTLFEMISNPQLQFNIFIKYLNKDLEKDFHLTPSDIKAIKNIVYTWFSDDKYTTTPHRSVNLKENFQKLGFIPCSYMRIVNGYVNTIIRETGYTGFFQVMLWNYFEAPIILEFPNGKKTVSYKWRSPEIIHAELIEYYKTKLKLDNKRINKMLKKATLPIKL